MKKLLILSFLLSSIISLEAQDSIYIMQQGVINYKNAVTNIDSIIFYTPTEYLQELTDFDGNTYNTVKIGRQVWMAENLRVTNYADGTPIDIIESEDDWAALENSEDNKACCWYNNDSTAYSSNGIYYTYGAVVNGTPQEGYQTVQGVCPDGWHVPSNTEWTELFDYVSNAGYYMEQGKALRSTTGWTNEDFNGTDVYGFGVYPVGYRNGSNSSSTGEFNIQGNYSCFWTSTKAKDGTAFIRKFGTTEAIIYLPDYTFMSYGYSVRCVMD